MANRNLTLILDERGNRGVIWCWVCPPRSSDLELHSTEATALADLSASTLSVTFLRLSKSQRSPFKRT